MSATVLDGSDLMLFITVGGKVQTIAFATSHKVAIKMKTREAASKDSGVWEEKFGGRMSWSISCDNLVSSDASISYKDIYALMIARAPIQIYSALATGTSPDWVKATTGGYTGKALITDLSQDAKDADNVSMSITLDGSGPYTPEPAV